MSARPGDQWRKRGGRTRRAAAAKRKRGSPIGRPRKLAKEKAKAVTLTLWRDEFDALDQRLARIQRASPGHVSRSDLVRVALALLERLSDVEVMRLLIALRDARRDL